MSPDAPEGTTPEPRSAFVVVRDDSSPGAPIYWAGLHRHYSDGGWSHSHMDAIRFARREDAKKVGSGINAAGTACHVEEHSWYGSPPSPPAPPVAPDGEAPIQTQIKAALPWAVNLSPTAQSQLVSFVAALSERVRELEAERDQMRKALSLYGDHLGFSCALRRGRDRCTCGFDEALKGAAHG